MSSTPLPVAIIGGGTTGLTAAFRLREKNIPVVLYETAGRVGGAVHTECENGYMAEWGPNTILDTSPKIGALISDLGLEPHRRYSDPGANKNFVVRGGKPVQLPTSPVAFMSSGLFSIPAKLRLMLEPIIRTPAASDDEALSEFVLRRLGREFLDYAINPFVSGIYAGDPAKLSVRYAFPKLHAVEAKYGSLILGQFLGARERRKRKETPKTEAKKVSFDDGLQVLIDGLAARLGDGIRLRSRVTHLRKHAGGWTVTVSSNGVEERREHSAVLLTAPAHQLGKIGLEGEEGASLAVLGEIEHPSVARIVLGFKREDVADPLEGFGFLVPEIEGLSILGTTYSSSIFANRAPVGHVTLTTFVGGCRNPELAGRDADELFDLTVKDLQRVLGVKGKPTYQHHVLFDRAIPQYNVGFGRFSDAMTDLEKRMPGLFFAGTFRDGISLGNAIVAGQEIAGRIAAHTGTNSQEASPTNAIA